MTLTTFPGVEQGSDEWYDQRRGMVTASVVKELVTPTLKIAANVSSRSLIADLVAQRITGFTEPECISNDMLRGMENEPRAIEAYAKHFDREITALGFMVREFDAEDGFPAIQIGYSPDGLVGTEGSLEVKSRMQKHHLRTILTDEVPGEFMAQIQGGLLVSGRDWCDFVSFCGGMPLWTKRVEPIPEWGTAIIQAVEAFEEAAVEMVTTYRAKVEGLPMTERIEYGSSTAGMVF
jgi:hypothetical protein